MIKFLGGIIYAPAWEHLGIPDPGSPGPVTYIYFLEGEAYIPMTCGRDVVPAPDWIPYVELKV